MGTPTTRVLIEIDTTGAAFTDDRNGLSETASILRAMADALDRAEIDFHDVPPFFRDVNGNRVATLDAE